MLYPRNLFSVKKARGPFGLRALVVIALDIKLEAALPPQIKLLPIHQLATEIGFKSRGDGKPESRLQSLERLRIQLLTVLLNNGVSVLINDLDAVWIQDPNKYIFERLGTSNDIVAQRSTFPVDLGRKSAHSAGKWGATVSAGFVFFRSSAATKEFVTLANKLLPLENSLPQWLNGALDKMNVDWPEVRKGGKMHMYGPGARLSVGTVDSLRLNVALLPPSLVLGMCELANATKPNEFIVQHCSVSRPQDIVPSLKRRHVWHLKAGWRLDAQAIARQGNMSRESAWRHVLAKVVPKKRKKKKPRPTPRVREDADPRHRQPQGGIIDRLVQRGRQVAPAPLIVIMASHNYLYTLLNFAERWVDQGGSHIFIIFIIYIYIYMYHI